MRIERLNKCCGPRGNLSAVDFQPRPQPANIHRIATSGGTHVQIWALMKPDGGNSHLPVKCVLLFTLKDHSPYDVTTVRWSPNGKYLASTDSGGVTNVLRMNEKKTEVMRRMVAAKLAGDPSLVPAEYTETTQVKRVAVKYDGTDQAKRHKGLQRISLTAGNVQVESKEVKTDNLNLLSQDNPEGNLEAWEAFATLPCPNNMGQLFDISWAPDNRSIIGGGMNGQVIVMDVHTKEVVAKFDALENTQDASAGRGYIKSVAWDPMTMFVAVQSSNKEVSIWRRSPPMPPGSPMKWTFKRVFYQENLAERSKTDVLGGSRIAWAPNGRAVVFPNAAANDTSFATCYAIQHNTAAFAHLLGSPEPDKNQLQYHFDTAEHVVEEEPLLLRGHNARIRNVSFSRDIMRAPQGDPGAERYMLLAQSSDDNVLSIWKFRLGSAAAAECICVLKNVLDEQSSIEDLSWGDCGTLLAVAASQGGLILVHLGYDEIGARLHSNRMQGLGIKEMAGPPPDLFTYSQQVATQDDAPSQSPADSAASSSAANGRCEGISVAARIAPEPNNLRRIFELAVYALYVLCVWYAGNRAEPAHSIKRPLEHHCLRTPEWFYLLSFTFEDDQKLGVGRKRQRGPRKQRAAPVQCDLVADVWLDMDYSKHNPFVENYWNESDPVPEVETKDPKTDAAKTHNEEVLVRVVKSDRPSRQTKPARSDRNKSGKASTANLRALDGAGGFAEPNEGLFSPPQLRRAFSVRVGPKRIVAVNFTNGAGAPRSSLTCFCEDGAKVLWLHRLKNGHVTHVEVEGALVMAVTQRTELDQAAYLTCVDLASGEVHANEVGLCLCAVSTFNAVTWDHTYLLFLTEHARLAVHRYEAGRASSLVDLDFSQCTVNKILKIELLNVTKNFDHLASQKLQGHRERCPFALRALDAAERLAVVVYKTNRTVAIFSAGQGELELNLESSAPPACAGADPADGFTVDSLLAFYADDFGSELFGRVEFDGAMASVLEAFDGAYARERFVRERDSPDALRLKMEAALLLGSPAEYLVYTYQYAMTLFEAANVREAVELTAGLYRSVLAALGTVDSPKHAPVQVPAAYAFAGLRQLVPHCLVLLRTVLVPTLKRVYAALKERVAPPQPDFEGLEALGGGCACFAGLGEDLMAQFEPPVDFGPDDRDVFAVGRAQTQKILSLLANVTIWEAMISVNRY